MIGESVLHYKIIQKLGEVYKAQDIKLDRFVALKFLPDRVNHNVEAKKRFLQETQVVAALNRTKIATIQNNNYFNHIIINKLQ